VILELFVFADYWFNIELINAIFKDYIIILFIFIFIFVLILGGPFVTCAWKFRLFSVINLVSLAVAKGEAIEVMLLTNRALYNVHAM
jgi:hypothetical protein